MDLEAEKHPVMIKVKSKLLNTTTPRSPTIQYQGLVLDVSTGQTLDLKKEDCVNITDNIVTHLCRLIILSPPTSNSDPPPTSFSFSLSSLSVRQQLLDGCVAAVLPIKADPDCECEFWITGASGQYQKTIKTATQHSRKSCQISHWAAHSSKQLLPGFEEKAIDMNYAFLFYVKIKLSNLCCAKLTDSKLFFVSTIQQYITPPLLQDEQNKELLLTDRGRD
ncbi:hypothetical protein F2P81_010441 [Scophthalmus maximus]|uniref:Uncharacterized protein n=1 Tax=Scophthalmus maximus TaxID=52904 RepID=A0A6A4SVN5_SCOMX|nr:hypothetical protein F2P81_010441 [Scophthalmus maximus]